jgi:clan AA aspartic protease
MREGRFHDGLPRMTLSLPGRGRDFTIEFVVDTGFDGGLTLPEDIARQLVADEPEVRLIRLAGGHQRRCLYYEVEMEDDDGELRRVEVLALEGNPLMGTGFLAEMLLSIEIIEGGSVAAETL